MAGVSQQPFRVLSLELGAGLAPTELISAKGLEYQNRRTQDYLRHAPVERPFCVQLFGGEPQSMALAAQRAVEAGAQMLDVNMGCPVKKVTKTGAGSALMCDPPRAAEIVRAMRQAVGDAVPVTAKIRSGWDATSITCMDLGKRLEDAGAAAVCLHARTRAQGYSGQADWSLIAELKRAVRIPVIGNGDVRGAADGQRMIAETGCDLVMVGRAALGNPWIFRSLCTGTDQPPRPDERLAVVLRHLREHVEHMGDVAHGVRTFRQHLLWYSRGLTGSAAFRQQATTLSQLAAVEELCHAFFGTATQSEPTNTEEDVDYATALG